MSHQSVPLVQPPVHSFSLKRFFSPENRYLAPAFITCILVVGHLSFGILESYKKTGIAIIASILTELVLGTLYRQMAHPRQRVH